MKSTLLLSALLLATSASATCVKPRDEDYTLLAATAFTQQINEQEFLLNRFCFQPTMKNKFEMGPVVMVSSVPGLKSLEKNWNMNFVEKGVDVFGSDLFTLRLAQNEPKTYFQETFNRANKMINTRFGEKSTPSLSLRDLEKSTPELLDYLSDSYSKTFNTTVNKFGNFALMYAVANNYPQYIDKSLGGTRDKKLFMKYNNSGFNPLHAAFSEKLKGKDTKALSDIIIALPTSYFVRSTIRGYDYFIFADVFKENNPYLHKLLKEKYKFNTTVKMNFQHFLDTKKSLQDLDYGYSDKD